MCVDSFGISVHSTVSPQGPALAFFLSELHASFLSLAFLPDWTAVPWGMDVVRADALVVALAHPHSTLPRAHGGTRVGLWTTGKVLC